MSEKVGFHDTAHFIQIFKKYVGTTPHQYRNLYG
ncbi:MAG: AraC family transcriptional regulator [Lachnospiraceae bacterium]